MLIFVIFSFHLFLISEKTLPFASLLFLYFLLLVVFFFEVFLCEDVVWILLRSFFHVTETAFTRKELHFLPKSVWQSGLDKAMDKVSANLGLKPLPKGEKLDKGDSCFVANQSLLLVHVFLSGKALTLEAIDCRFATHEEKMLVC